jgi:hypothetical protein
MAKKLSDTVKNRASGLVPFADQPMKKGGVGPKVWHGLPGTQRHGLILPPGPGPAPGRDVRRAKGIPAQSGGKKIVSFEVEDRPKRRRV